jgi:Protein of unknown function (DUF3050)
MICGKAAWPKIRVSPPGLLHTEHVPTQSESITRLLEVVAPARQRLVDHPLYREIRDIQHLRIFLQSHVFAVWDFMSLLKSLQACLTCVATPWLPSAYPKSRRLINEIVLGEESDNFGDGYISHFELYLQAMVEAGADTSAIRNLIDELKSGRELPDALSVAGPPAEAVEFVRTTFSFLQLDKPHVTVAAFTFGREDLIPGMFRQMVKDLRQNLETVGLFEYYLDRHVEVDADSHGPMALQMVEELCGPVERKWEEAGLGAVTALQARLALWDGILRRIRRIAD